MMGATPQQGPLGPIQIIPPGLTGLLQLKQMGRLPDRMSDTVAPVLELRDWYMTASRETEIGIFGAAPSVALITANIGIRDFVPQVLIPGNQIWYVEQMTVKCSPTGAEVATDAVRFAPCLYIPGAGSGELVGTDVSDYTLAARSREIRASASRGFWAFPGDALAVDVFDILTTNGYTFQLTFRATRCMK